MAGYQNTSVYLCNVPFDNTYEHQVYCETKEKQDTYFAGRVKTSFSEAYWIRKTMPDGSLRNSVKLSITYEVANHYGINYLYYNNGNLNNKPYYCFVTQILYVDESTTEFVFELDVFQTWIFDVDIKGGYVVRGHTPTDKLGDNVVPEHFNFDDFVYAAPRCWYGSSSSIKADDIVGKWGYVIVSSALRNTDDSSWPRGRLHSGVYQGLYFYYTEEVNTLNTILNDIESNKSDSIISIMAVPRFCISNSIVTDSGLVGDTMLPNQKTFSLWVHDDDARFGSFVPTNMKLYTAPYFTISVTDNNGTEAIYPLEDFEDVNSMGYAFTMFGDISCSPSVTLVPFAYKGLYNSNSVGISLSGFPQCSFNNDTFKLWLSKNEFAVKSGIALDLATIFGGLATLATIPATGGMSAAALGAANATMAGGAAATMAGVGGIAKTIGNVYSASKEPNKNTVGNTKNNLLTAMGQNTFRINFRKLKEWQARMVDEYFTRYGYQQNSYSAIILKPRKYYAYLQTASIDIVGTIPNDDMNKLKSIFNNGVTLWTLQGEIGYYRSDNSTLELG